MKIWFTKEFMKAAAALLVVFLAGAGVGYMGGRKHAEYGLLKRGSRARPAPAPPGARGASCGCSRGI